VKNHPIPQQYGVFKPESIISNHEQYLGVICRNLPRQLPFLKVKVKGSVLNGA
jgi:hypothetical protein